MKFFYFTQAILQLALAAFLSLGRQCLIQYAFPSMEGRPLPPLTVLVVEKGFLIFLFPVAAMLGGALSNRYPVLRSQWVLTLFTASVLLAFVVYAVALFLPFIAVTVCIGKP
ncbi:MAG: hypothetical protein J6U40_10590 [Kiritimatiellae bacterium]|nr:hypothetical protein [Kiritimatiellia bacterium]MBP5226227.1 hypothetical protein [Kiritimatiellia bacterium]